MGDLFGRSCCIDVCCGRLRYACSARRAALSCHASPVSQYSAATPYDAMSLLLSNMHMFKHEESVCGGQAVRLCSRYVLETAAETDMNVQEFRSRRTKVVSKRGYEAPWRVRRAGRNALLTPLTALRCLNVRAQALRHLSSRLSNNSMHGKRTVHRAYYALCT